jgi:hypothetical protein
MEIKPNLLQESPSNAHSLCVERKKENCSGGMSEMKEQICLVTD